MTTIFVKPIEIGWIENIDPAQVNDPHLIALPISLQPKDKIVLFNGLPAIITRDNVMIWRADPKTLADQYHG